MSDRRPPGLIRDAIIEAFHSGRGEMSVAEIRAKVGEVVGDDAPASSVRSYLNINTPGRFERTARGKYRLIRR